MTTKGMRARLVEMEAELKAGNKALDALEKLRGVTQKVGVPTAALHELHRVCIPEAPINVSHTDPFRS